MEENVSDVAYTKSETKAPMKQAKMPASLFDDSPKSQLGCSKLISVL